MKIMKQPMIISYMENMSQTTLYLITILDIVSLKLTTMKKLTKYYLVIKNMEEKNY